MGDYAYLNLHLMKMGHGKETEWASVLDAQLGTDFLSENDLELGMIDCEDFPVGAAENLAKLLVQTDKDAVWWMLHAAYEGEPGYLAVYNYELGLYVHPSNDEGEPIVPTRLLVELIDAPDATLESVRDGIRALYGIAWRQWQEDYVDNGDKREREALAREEAEVLESIKAAFRNQS